VSSIAQGTALGDAVAEANELVARNKAQTDLILSLNSQVAALTNALKVEQHVSAVLSEALEKHTSLAMLGRRVRTMLETHGSAARQLRAALHGAGIPHDV